MKNCQLPLLVRVPDWARWMAQDAEGNLRVFEFKPQPEAPDGSVLWWDSKTRPGREFGQVLMSQNNFDLWEMDPPQFDKALPGWRDSLQRVRR